jgi:hypothetical protein
LSYFANRFQQQVTKIIAGLNISIRSLLTYSQIWLIPLGDDFQCGYITKSRKSKEKKKEKKSHALKNGVKL